MSQGIKHLQMMDKLVIELWFFPKGYNTTLVDLELSRKSLNSILGTSTTLKDSFTFYFNDQSKGRPPNFSLLHAAQPFYWKGDILVIKNKGECRVTNVARDDIPLIYNILQA
jgi:hypothetical protein